MITRNHVWCYSAKHAKVIKYTTLNRLIQFHTTLLYLLREALPGEPVQSVVPSSVYPIIENAFLLSFYIYRYPVDRQI